MIDSISQLLQLMKSYGATRFYAKKLSPNDNSKNQVYLGKDFSALNIIPYKNIYQDGNDIAKSRRERAKAEISFYWIDSEGKYMAPDTQLILYPEYPEVRMSGFLRSCKKAPSNIMNVRDEGRVLFLGIADNGDVLGYAVDAQSTLSKELYKQDKWRNSGIFIEIPPDANKLRDTKSQLLSTLKCIYEKHWISSRKISSDSSIMPYSATNGGGYTLEAELGIAPNGCSEPDYLGWEIKQYGVRDFNKFRPKSAITLMTKEPSEGIYKDGGIKEFINKFGYKDKNGKPDRMNFGGGYACNKDYHHETGLRLILDGYDNVSGKITNMQGSLLLISQKDEIAAKWGFFNLMEHWTCKHAQAAYVPSLFRKPPPEYSYGSKVLLCEETSFLLFLKAVASGAIYYDPAIKIEGIQTSKPKIKRRSQFRIKHSQLTTLYRKSEVVDLDIYTAPYSQDD